MSVSKKKTIVRIALISMMTVVMLMSSVTVFAARGHFYSSWASQGVTARITFKDLISRLNLWRGAGFPDQGDHDETITDLEQTTHSGSRIDVKNVTYKDTISKKCVYDVSFIDDGKLKPVIIAVHGGSWNGGSKNEMIYVANTFVPQGYVVVLVEYETLKNNKYIED